MKWSALGIVLFFFVAASASGQARARSAGAERALEAVEREFIRALERNDRAALERLLADGFAFIHASGKRDTRAEYIELVAAGLQLRQRAQSERVNEPWRIYGGHTAVREARAVISGRRLRNTAVYAREGERWRLVSLQSTGLPTRPAAASVDPRLYASYVGDYQIDAGRTLVVTSEGGTLRGRVPLRSDFELVPRSDTVFIRHNDEGGFGDEIVFVRDVEGRVTHAALRGAGQEAWRARKVR